MRIRRLAATVAMLVATLAGCGEAPVRDCAITAASTSIVDGKFSIQTIGLTGCTSNQDNVWVLVVQQNNNFFRAAKVEPSPTRSYSVTTEPITLYNDAFMVLVAVSDEDSELIRNTPPDTAIPFADGTPLEVLGRTQLNSG